MKGCPEMPGILETVFDERLSEVMAYLDFLDALQAATQHGAPRFGETGATISPDQTSILKAGVFVQLYNLIEATMTRCLEALAAASANGRWVPGDLTPAFRKEWVKVVVNTNQDLNAENRLRNAITLTELLVTPQPLRAFKIEKGGGGNWNDTAIEEMLDRLGLRLILAPTVRTAAKRRVRDKDGPLALVVKLRNKLAHGSISFKECGENETVTVLREIARDTAMYLRSVVRAVERSIERHEFLAPDRRPVPA
jgi:hypothetical protein